VEIHRLPHFLLVPRAHGEVHVLAGDVVGAVPHVPDLLVSLAFRGLAVCSLERGHQGPLLVARVRRVLVVIEVGEVVLLVVVDLVGHPGVDRVEDLRVRRSRFSFATMLCMFVIISHHARIG
jgi:hypothetical protein